MTIVDNRKAFHEYFIEDRLEAGLQLEGWEVKAIRAGRVALKESYVTYINGDFYLMGAHISPLVSTSTHTYADPVRLRKLLLKRNEIAKWAEKVDRSGYTVAALNMHFAHGYIKLDIGLAKGKKQHDKRQTEKEREWVREKARIVRDHTKQG
ncbi:MULTISPECIES: SsrA-binding protein SmpB [Silvimonas]|uniref:SsrA-binding protein SmpB n=1 Tax=Silvimonas TaxID=300264 RepID=UPI0024B35EBC|nr:MULTISPECIES: SsrA-binding protein SmpB [Silvimonas]MDR3428540.1 SsrA-binding protein SmpB [Silvimonas sp.]